MSWMDTAWDVGKEAVSLGAEAAHAGHVVGGTIGKSLPLVGTVLNGIDALRYYGKSEDSERTGEADEADYYHDKAGYSLLKAIPGVGTGLGIAELCAGVGSTVNHPEQRMDKSFHEGMETVGDYVMDLGAMAGFGALGAPNPIPGTGAPPYRTDRYGGDDGYDDENLHDRLGSHKSLRKTIEQRHALNERAGHAH